MSLGFQTVAQPVRTGAEFTRAFFLVAPFLGRKLSARVRAWCNDAPAAVAGAPQPPCNRRLVAPAGQRAVVELKALPA